MKIFKQNNSICKSIRSPSKQLSKFEQTLHNFLETGIEKVSKIKSDQTDVKNDDDLIGEIQAKTSKKKKYNTIKTFKSEGKMKLLQYYKDNEEVLFGDFEIIDGVHVNDNAWQEAFAKFGEEFGYSGISDMKQKLKEWILGLNNRLDKFKQLSIFEKELHNFLTDGIPNKELKVVGSDYVYNKDPLIDDTEHNEKDSGVCPHCGKVHNILKLVNRY